MHLPQFLIDLGVCSKGNDCERAGGFHDWYNKDGLHSACYHCDVIRQGRLWEHSPLHSMVEGQAEQVGAPNCSLLLTMNTMTSAYGQEDPSLSPKNAKQFGILTSFRGASDCTVRLQTGEEIQAILDIEALRRRHGRVYGITIEGAVEIENGIPPRIIAIEQHDDTAKPAEAPPDPTVNELEQAIVSLRSGPWDPIKLITALVPSEAYLLLEDSSDPDTYLILVADEIPHVAFFTSSLRFESAQTQHPGFIYPHKIRPWQFIKSLNDGVGFIINPHSPDCEYYAGATHTAAIRDISP